MTSLSKKEFNKDIETKVDDIRGIKKIALKVTLYEFIEMYSYRFDHLSLGSFWYSVNDDIDYSNISYGGTDPE